MWRRNLVPPWNSLSVHRIAKGMRFYATYDPTKLDPFSPCWRKKVHPRDIPNHAGTHASLSFAKHLLLKEPNKNLIFSPLLVNTFLSLLATGSKDCTLHQILSFLKADSVDDLFSSTSNLSGDGGPCFDFANAVWFHPSLILKPSFKQILESHYKAALTLSPTQAAAQVPQQINSWVKTNTNGLIKEVVQEGSLGYFHSLNFINALNFEGAWRHRFYKTKTKNFELHCLVNDGKSVIAPLMQSSKREHLFRDCHGFTVLGHPYELENCDFTMYIFHPKSKDGLASLVERLCTESDFLKKHLPLEKPVRVYDVRMPKFKISYEFMAFDLLKELGLPSLPSSEGELADFVDGKTLSISNMFQKAFIEVNEQGTKVAATTAMTVLEANGEGKKAEVDIVVDRPFLFIIMDDVSGAMLFVGQVLNPLYH